MQIVFGFGFGFTLAAAMVWLVVVYPNTDVSLRNFWWSMCAGAASALIGIFVAAAVLAGYWHKD